MLNLILATLSIFHYVNSPVINIRETASESSEVVSQSYYSEEVKILEETENFLKIETVVDHYQGWIQKGSLFQRNAPLTSTVKVDRCAAHLYSVQDTVYGSILTLPYESKLQVLDDSNSRWLKVLLIDSREAYIQRGDVNFDSSLFSKDMMTMISLQFLGLPYTWGGRSSFGYDCSGFTQMLYRQMGINLSRDSKDQMNFEGFVNTPLDALQSGDLIFFGLAEDKICHVGMYLDHNLFIHATVAENAPYIHISNITDPEWNGSGRFSYRTARTLRSD